MKNSIGSLLKKSFGFALLFALYNNSRTVYYTSAITNSGMDTLAFSLITMFVSPLFSFVLVYISTRSTKIYDYLPKLMITFSLLGYALWGWMIFLPQNSVVNSVFMTIIACFLAVGLTSGLTCWMISLTVESPTSLGYCLTLTLGFWALIVFMLLSINLSIRIGLMVVLFLFSFSLLRGDYKKAVKELSTGVSFQLANPKEELKTILLKLWKPIACVSALSFSSGAIRVVGVASHDNVFIPAALGISAAVATLVFFLVRQKAKNGSSVVHFYPLALLVSATACLLLPYFAPNFRLVILGVIDVAFLFLLLCLWIESILAAKSTGISPILVVCLSSGITRFFTATGSLTGSFFRIDPDMQNVLLLSLSIVYIIGVTAVVISVQLWKGKGILSDKKTAGIVVGISEDDIRSNKALITQYQLTERELDVVLLILGGRNAGSIAEALYLSENTVRTHMKRIYKKMNVHSKEEVMVIVEQIIRSDS